MGKVMRETEEKGERRSNEQLDRLSERNPS